MTWDVYKWKFKKKVFFNTLVKNKSHLKIKKKTKTQQTTISMEEFKTPQSSII